MMFGRRLLRYLPRIIWRVEKPVEELAKRPGIWETLGGAVRFAGKWIGRPLAVGAGLFGFAHLGSMGIKEVREALGIKTPEEKAKEIADAQTEILEQIRKNMETYIKLLNAMRSAQIPGYQPYSITPGFYPEWMTPSDFGITPKDEEKAKGGFGFDWTWLILLAGLGVLAYGVFKKGK